MSNCQLIDTNNKLDLLLQFFKDKEIFACDLESSGLDTKLAKLEGIGVGTADQQYFIPFPNELSKSLLNKTLENIFKERRVIFHNAKFDLELLIENGLPYPEVFDDTMIMSWLIDEEGVHGLKPLTKAIFGGDAKKWNELNRKVDLFRSAEEVTQELCDYCGEDVRNTYNLYYYFLPTLKEEGLYIDYEKIELKLIPVLVNMELRGVRIDTDWLKNGREKIADILKELEKKMQDLLEKKDINIRSSSQLESLLFDTFKYKPQRITNAGKRSTDNDVLETLVKQNELKEDDFVPLLLKFRDMDKLYSTYFVALLEQAGEEGVISTNFMQHGTRTGRLASRDPNLQNIPVRKDAWDVRKSFIPREGYKFLIADYSQIELRMLAHFSQDMNMVRIFNEGGDIHKKTMELTGTERRIAKAINFGLIYGMGPRTLAHTLGIKEDDARVYIEKFFAGYPRVNYFIRSVQRNTFREGYVKMITGRRRRFREIRDRRWFNTINRQSINTKIQGSAADLIKLAMVRLEPKLSELDAHQLIQIHDEIIIEVPVDKIKKTYDVIKDTMENVLKLRVPLVVNIIEGDCWLKD